ncbi:hypothetical protein BJX68DRAFT_264937 [Aspergillus pseudodeflectus]|uniref:Uncharacterized protein n=1 Tax=Aspergillus pseudodeflectus TaxID=176178 RepID=A0ABR4KPI6_9EURO
MPPTRYNLRPRIGKWPYNIYRRFDPRPRPATPNNGRGEIFSRVISKSPKRDTLLLYQEPEKWTREHLRIANVEHEVDVPIERIIDPRYIPPDDSKKFRKMEKYFRNPPWLVPGSDRPDRSKGIDPTIPFFNFFTAIQYGASCGRLDSGGVHDTIDLIDDIVKEVFRDRRIRVRQHDHIPLTAFGLWRKERYGQRVDATISCVGCDRTDGVLRLVSGIPLAVITANRKRGELGMARYEIPQLLLQLNMVYNFDATREEYDAFLVSFDEPFRYTFIRAVASADYIRSIRGNEPAKGALKVLRSRRYDIAGMDWVARKEFLRNMIGLCRYLVSRPEYKFPVHEI